MNPEFDKKVSQTIQFSVPVMSVEELKSNTQKLRIFDARERAEFEVSHILGAEWVGYRHFDIRAYAKLPKETPIVVYCSIGYRSEKIGEQLKANGFTEVYNLYGSIFEWANKGYPLVDGKGREVREVHTYNKEWSRWVDETKAKKIW
ncbi:MAG TPA: rhodanese-like domain-containing protein [Saprospiraceae bacterium]|nr:rhodanese-like domain-containing protein [Saprospiraceae bacterium]HRJ14220.1 rhodanese-like domain-containing protein [Saprospiraceae bacterium]HRK82995.1 rhodanese-like domain-containing protein [Saprospiraceae bacterium]